MICAGLSREQCNDLYLQVLEEDDREAQRKLCREDLFFLLTIGCKRKDVNRPWLYDRCREVEANPDGFLDLWARDHYKSTIITFAQSISDILNDPSVTIGIFSHTRPIAKAFLNQIKSELEKNSYLKALFPEVLYANPQTESPKWSLDGGIVVKRETNPKESTIEAWGLVDGQPTSKHFKVLVYDDVVTKESVTTPEQIKKTTEAFEMSLNLGTEGGRKRGIGTRYHFNDTYDTIMKRETLRPRLYPARAGGKIDGAPVFLSEDTLKQKRRDQGPYTFGSQMLQDPVADKAMGFRREWLRYYKSLGDTSKWNRYILVDPASKKKKTSDYTVMKVIGLAPDNNYYLLDAIRDRLNLTQRAAALFKLHRKWLPLKTGYESYGLQSDVEHIRYEQEHQNYRFEIVELGGTMAKEDRIRMLVPVYEQGRWWMPEQLNYVDYEGRNVDYVKVFVEDEFTAFPVSTHDDMLDCEARILDPVLGAEFPKIEKPRPRPEQRPTGWMG